LSTRIFSRLLTKATKNAKLQEKEEIPLKD
jgi:hypothetical protein